MHQSFPALDTFGQRICICGPSNGGKSTLAAAIGKKLDLPVLHLDQLFHLPNTNWVPRDRNEFRVLLEEAAKGESWIMDGNYSKDSDLRWQRTTGIILLGTDRWSAFGRYLNRTLLQRNRPGGLEGGEDVLNWNMIRWILIRQPKTREEYAARLQAFDKPFLRLNSFGELKQAYAAWGLTS